MAGLGWLRLSLQLRFDCSHAHERLVSSAAGGACRDAGTPYAGSARHGTGHCCANDYQTSG